MLSELIVSIADNLSTTILLVGALCFILGIIFPKVTTGIYTGINKKKCNMSPYFDEPVQRHVPPMPKGTSTTEDKADSNDEGAVSS